MKSLKTLGTRSETKRDKVEEALMLEKLGKGTEETQAILYEEREVKEWTEEDSPFGNMVTNEFDTDKMDEDEQPKTSSFIDHRPKGPQGMGFGFQTATKITSKKAKPKYNWRARLEQEKARKRGIEMYGDGSSDENSSENSDQDSEDDGSSDGTGDDVEEDEEDEEWAGFEDDGAKATSINGNGLNRSIDVDDEQDFEEDDDNEDDDDEDDEDEEEDEEDDGKSKGQQFKEWANQMINPESERIETPVFKGTYTPLDRSEDKEALPSEYVVPEKAVDRKAYYVNVERSDEIQQARIQLPVVSEEQRIMEAIHNNDTVVICGETGSGKTTQVPQFLFEAGYGHPESKTPGMIGITQPRRVAAVSMSNRVSNELGNYGSKVGYQIRFDATVKPDTAMKFMTDGVLLRELTTDFALTKYSCIIIDEAHERNINTDILIGVLSRVVSLRKEMSSNPDSKLSPLKLVIMSATLRVSDFTENSSLFPNPPPVLKVEARQFPVSVHFNRRTPHDYLDETYKKAVKIHQKLPPGGILIFLTGQNEINQVCRKLKQAFPFKKGHKLAATETSVKVRVSAQESVTEVEDIDFGLEETLQPERRVTSDDIVDDYDEDDEEEEEGFEETIEEGQDINAPLHVLPLYSLLPTKEQMKVFQEVPAGSRLCVVATNVAETSLTIPGIRYVVDCGRSKERHYDEETGVQSFRVSWTSKASADQRAGRAGRTGPGHCYRIFSSAVFERDFNQFSKPEILRMPIEGLVLQMKSMGIDNILNFPFPTPPPANSLGKGLRLLQFLGALSQADKPLLTELGKSMSLFPLTPRFAKMLIISNQHGCLPYIIAIVAALTVGEPFLTQEEVGINIISGQGNESDDDDDDAENDISIELKEANRRLRSEYFGALQRFSALDFKCDALKTLAAVCAFDFDKDRESFCKKNFLRFKAMEEISKLRKQLAYLVAVNTRPNAVDSTVQKLNAKLGPPSAVQIKALKQMIAAGFIDQVAGRADIVGTDEIKSKQRVITFPYIPLFPTSVANIDPYQARDPYVYIHPGSILANGGGAPPEYIIYASVHVNEGHRAGQTPKVRMKPLTDITPSQLSNVARSSALITYSKPLGPPYGPRSITPTKRECWVVPRFGAAIGSGSVGWDLPAKKVIQEKDGTNWVVTSDA
ncbi:Ecm16p [Sugiyamaella lignohabitans]|uniref:RNA helicase n=1 Tax=Sugiyamaella lignohabitans TaxID=796027 RepID=A0A161HLG4_9ASCO|nr:Ecm16p [Sugiyamaella lignohabitans]ANB14177.1 Ecm16p [Sugiyamaella lignohabitans]